MDHQLRPYQTAAIAAVRVHWAAGRRRVVVALPTGAGKTVVATPLACGPRALAIVHTRTLLEQTRRRMPGVQVATVQAVLAAGTPIRDVDVVFVDECHHIPSASWHRVLELLSADVRVVGCTATPTRADGTAMGSCFDALVSTATYSELLRTGHLAPCRVVQATGMDPAAAYLAHGARRPGVLFSPTVARCEAAVVALERAGVRAAVIAGTTPDATRRRVFAAFERGDLDLLASPMALSEGFDSPRVAVCVLDRSCEHVGVYLQTAGRALRPHPSKTAAHPAVLIDLRGAAARHGSPLDDRIYSLHGTPIRRAAPPAARRGAVQVGVQLGAGRARPMSPGDRPALAVGRAVGATLRGWLASLFG